MELAMYSRSPQNRRNQPTQWRQLPAVHPLAEVVSAGLIPGDSGLPFNGGVWSSYEKSLCQAPVAAAEPAQADEEEEECGSTL
jgi:hypothetical protein